MNPGTILHHKYLQGYTAELVEPTNRGWKVIERVTTSRRKKERDGVTRYYTTLDIKTQWEVAA